MGAHLHLNIARGYAPKAPTRPASVYLRRGHDESERGKHRRQAAWRETNVQRARTPAHAVHIRP